MDLKPSRRTMVSIVVVIMLASLIVGFIWEKNGKSLDFSETEAKIVVSGSMDGERRTQYEIETIPTGSMVIIHRVPADSQSFYSSLKVGDVLTFDYTHPVSKENMVVTHRIISISESAGVYTYTLKGDSIADDPTNGSVQTVTSVSGDVIGKVVGVSHALGVIAVFMSTWTGKLCLVLIPCIILIVSEVRNIVRILRNGDEEEGSAEEPVEDHIPEACPEADPVEEPLFITSEERVAARGGHIER